MKIYIDINDGFKCYTSYKKGLLEFEETHFDGKCPEFIEGYRCKPVGYTWTDENGNLFGDSYKMISPWKDYSILTAAQAAYEEGQAQGGSEALIEAADVAYKEGVNSAYD